MLSFFSFANSGAACSSVGPQLGIEDARSKRNPCMLCFPLTNQHCSKRQGTPAFSPRFSPSRVCVLFHWPLSNCSTVWTWAVCRCYLALLLWGDIGLARNMCKIQPPKPGPTQTPCAPPVRELWVACSATQELPTRLSYEPRTLEQKSNSVGIKKSCAGSAGAKKSVLDTQVTHWHTASRRCQPALSQTDRG